MSGLETAIRNALDRSDRADRDIRARIYQSARQALDAGLRKQGVSDRLIVMQQHELLERRIHEIEMEEVRRLEAGPAEILPPDIFPDAPAIHADPGPRAQAAAYPAAPEPMAMRHAEAQPVEVEPPVARSAPAAHAVPDMTLEGETRAPENRGSVAPDVAVEAPSGPIPQATASEHAALDEMLAELDNARERPMRPAAPEPEQRAPSRREQRKGKAAKPPKQSRKTAAASRGTGLDVPPERAAKPRKRRGFLSHLLNWFITLAIVGGACWYFYQSGMVQSFIDDALKTADEQSGGGANSSRLDPRRGFSDAWREVFSPAKLAQLKPGADAKVEAVAASEGQAARIISASPGDTGDVSIDVPPELLREMAGKNSTVALTLQSGTNGSVQLSVRCDFGSLGSCSRHRFTATQEKLEALFQVSFDRSLAPNRPGRLILNSGIGGANRPVMLYSVRILPGQ